MKFVCQSRGQTMKLGHRIAGVLQPGDVLAFSGALGSGKTTLIQGIAKGLGVTERVQSPSFVLVRTYDARLRIKHVDLYRLEGTGEVDGLHLEEIYDPQGVMLAEWAERADNLPGNVSPVTIDFVEGSPESRIITIGNPLGERL